MLLAVISLAGVYICRQCINVSSIRNYRGTEDKIKKRSHAAERESNYVRRHEDATNDWRGTTCGGLRDTGGPRLSLAEREQGWGGRITLARIRAHGSVQQCTVMDHSVRMVSSEDTTRPRAVYSIDQILGTNTTSSAPTQSQGKKNNHRTLCL